MGGFVFRVASDIDECRELWQKVMPRDLFTDLWEVRECFHRHFHNVPHFIVSSEENVINALLPLCLVGAHGYYGYFPGEVWHGKTWLEQNRVFSRDGNIEDLLRQVPPNNYIRYMLPSEYQLPVDEIGYLFEPSRYDYDMENYFQEFSSKSRKRLQKDLAALKARGVDYRFDNISDFEYMADLSVARFGGDSYFHDQRFRDSFRALMNYLNENGMMRITTILLGGEIAAVDLGCIYNGAYTLLAGGTSAAFPGVAKLINIHHMEYACEQKFATVDFLCGDFAWKPLFHLTPRSLYMISDMNINPDSIIAEVAHCPTR